MPFAVSREFTHDVLCVGHASYDLVFSVPHHPLADEKIFAEEFIACGGGPAANAAVIASRLGFRSAFAGYLGNDLYGESHALELLKEGVDARWMVRGSDPTPLSCVLVKPDGARALVNYKGSTRHLPAGRIDFSDIHPKLVMFDGHEPLVSIPLADQSRTKGIPTLLDAGSLHQGTQALMSRVDYLVASEKFALQWCQGNDETALVKLSELAPVVVITLGERGLIWRKDGVNGALPAFPIQAVDTTGAGDALHGAFAAGLVAGLPWEELLRYASAAGAIACQRSGARHGLATAAEIADFLLQFPPHRAKKC
ncbi:MAG: carbohydrate kinase family protein [Candidatus Methylumidiphilus sp.]